MRARLRRAYSCFQAVKNRKRPRGGHASKENAMTQPQTEFVDLYRAGLKTAADLMKASLQSAERLQNQQLVIIRSALEQQTKSINDLGQARTIDELLAIQARFAGVQLERAVGYWNELCHSQMERARDWMNEAQNAPFASQDAQQIAKARRPSAASSS